MLMWLNRLLERWIDRLQERNDRKARELKQKY